MLYCLATQNFSTQMGKFMMHPSSSYSTTEWNTLVDYLSFLYNFWHFYLLFSVWEHLFFHDCVFIFIGFYDVHHPVKVFFRSFAQVAMLQAIENKSFPTWLEPSASLFRGLCANRSACVSQVVNTQGSEEWGTRFQSCQKGFIFYGLQHSNLAKIPE